jgi:6-phosphofructokinase 1
MNTIAPKKVLILTSGGDAPGMNAAIRAIVRAATYYDMVPYGCDLGFRGLLENNIFPMDRRQVSNCIQRGGTMLKTCRSSEFFHRDKRDFARKNLEKHGIDAMVVLGGDGSFKGSALLRKEGGPNVIGVPSTIDNDIIGTDYTIGFDTAINTALDAIDRIRDTASSLERNFMVEVMGKSSGFIAMEVGIAGGAEIILVPEFPISEEQIIRKIEKQKRQKKLTSIIVAAEANKPGHTIDLAERINAADPDIEFKVCVLGHVQRGGSPTAYDRRTASLMGVQAIEALKIGLTNKMVAVEKGKITLADFPLTGETTRYLTNKHLLEINDDILCL